MNNAKTRTQIAETINMIKDWEAAVGKNDFAKLGAHGFQMLVMYGDLDSLTRHLDSLLIEATFEEGNTYYIGDYDYSPLRTPEVTGELVKIDERYAILKTTEGDEYHYKIEDLAFAIREGSVTIKEIK